MVLGGGVGLYVWLNVRGPNIGCIDGDQSEKVNGSCFSIFRDLQEFDISAPLQTLKFRVIEHDSINFEIVLKELLSRRQNIFPSPSRERRSEAETAHFLVFAYLFVVIESQDVQQNLDLI